MRFLERLNTPGAVFVVLALFLVVDGWIFYRYRALETATTSPSVALERPATALSSDPGPATSNGEGSDSALQGETRAEETDEEADFAGYLPAPALYADYSTTPVVADSAEPVVVPTAAPASTNGEPFLEGDPAYEEQYEGYYG